MISKRWQRRRHNTIISFWFVVREPKTVKLFCKTARNCWIYWTARAPSASAVTMRNSFNCHILVSRRQRPQQQPQPSRRKMQSVPDTVYSFSRQCDRIRRPTKWSISKPHRPVARQSFACHQPIKLPPPLRNRIKRPMRIQKDRFFCNNVWIKMALQTYRFYCKRSNDWINRRQFCSFEMPRAQVQRWPRRRRLWKQQRPPPPIILLCSTMRMPKRTQVAAAAAVPQRTRPFHRIYHWAPVSLILCNFFLQFYGLLWTKPFIPQMNYAN